MTAKNDARFANAVNAGDGAKLKTRKDNTTGVKSKLMRIPNEFTERYEALKAQNKTTMDFHAFILEALREKLNREEK